MNALVTGATGFIGRYLCGKLKQRGDQVFALSHSGATLPDGTPTTGVELAGELPDELFDGIEVIYHLAGIAHQKADADEYESVNHQATLRIARQAAKAGAKSFTYLSSVKAMGESRNSTPRNEDDCFPPEDAYGQSKWHAECALREEYSGGAMSVTIVRPVLVYGPGVKGNVRQLTAAVRCGLPRPPAGGARSIIALEDLCGLIIAAANMPATGVRTWIASGGDYHVQQIYDQLRSELGLARNSSWTPDWTWRAATALLDIYSRNKIGSSYHKLFSADLYSNECALLATGWKPEITLEKICQDLLEPWQP